MGISTGRGDSGTTGLADNARVPKDHPAIEALGDLDELSSAIGLARCALVDASLRDRLERVQRALFAVCALLAKPAAVSTAVTDATTLVAAQRELDTWLAEAEAVAEAKAVIQPSGFVLPGSTESAARLDLCRAICRRAERRVVHALSGAPHQGMLPYLNRLSDWLYLASRAQEHDEIRPV